MPPQSHSRQSSASERSPSPEVEDLSLAAFLSKIDEIKQKWDEKNGNSTYQTEFGTQWSSQEWSDNFKGAFEAVGWENQSEKWQKAAMRFIKSHEVDNIYSAYFPSLEQFTRSRDRAKPMSSLATDDEGLTWLQSLVLKEPEGTAMQGRLTVMAKTVENILRAQDEEAFLELYSALSACSKISELALKGGISELSIRVSYLPKVADLLEIAGKAVIKVNKAHKSNVNKRNAANPRKKASSAIVGDGVGHSADREGKRAKRKAFSPVSRREGSTHAGASDARATALRDETYERIMKVASSYPGKIQGEAQERLYELWQAFDLDYDEKLDWLLAGLERLAQKHLLPNPRVFPTSIEELDKLWEISGGHKDKTPDFGEYNQWLIRSRRH